MRYGGSEGQYGGIGKFENQILFSRGTASLPSIGWQGDADGSGTGIYSSGTDCIDFAIGGTDVARFNASGHFLWPTNNTFDIGASGVGGTTAPRNIYAGTNVFAGGYAVPKILSKSAIPFIHLSSGSVSAPGAITGLTNLPLIYPRAYCYFPANALATSIAAGWYYCTFTTLSSGTAFLDTYTSGTPTVPSSPTAVTDGKGAFTGDTSERVGPSITLPANALGANGKLHVLKATSHANNANVKAIKVKLGAGGTAFENNSVASTTASRMLCEIMNAGATNSQMGYSWGFAGAAGSGAIVLAPLLGTVDTTAQLAIEITINKGTATDQLVMLNYEMLLFSDGT